VKGATYQPIEISLEKVAAREVVNKFEEMLFYEDIISIFGICDFPRGSKNGSREGQGYCGMAFPKEHLLGNKFRWLSKLLQEVCQEF
jgi:hypothetical protein